jgi:hypothetical protein
MSITGDPLAEMSMRLSAAEERLSHLQQGGTTKNASGTFSSAAGVTINVGDTTNWCSASLLVPSTVCFVEVAITVKAKGGDNGAGWLYPYFDVRRNGAVLSDRGNIHTYPFDAGLTTTLPAQTDWLTMPHWAVIRESGGGGMVTYGCYTAGIPIDTPNAPKVYEARIWARIRRV